MREQGPGRGAVDYGRVFRDAWHGMWRSGGQWVFLGLFYLLFVVLFGVAVVLAYFLGGDELVRGRLPDLPAVLALVAPFAGAALASAPLAVLMHGGMIGLSARTQERLPGGVRDGFAEGAASFVRLFVLELLIVLLGGLAFIAIAGVVAGVIAALGVSLSGGTASAGGSEGMGIAAWVGATCCGYVLFLAFAAVAGMFFTMLEGVGSRYAVVAGTPGAIAFGEAWRRWFDRFGHMLLMALILLGLQFVFGLLGQIVMLPLQFASPSKLGVPSVRYLTVFGLLFVALLALQLPFTMLRYHLLTAFFRCLPPSLPAASVVREGPAPAAGPPSPPASDAPSGRPDG